MTTRRKPRTASPKLRAERRMWRVSQRAHQFVDRRKAAARRAARGRTARGADHG